MTAFTKIVILKSIAGACFVMGGNLINDVIIYKENLRQKELEKKHEEINRKFIADLKETQKQFGYEIFK